MQLAFSHSNKELRVGADGKGRFISSTLNSSVGYKL
jgi:hypothetical protein